MRNFVGIVESQIEIPESIKIHQTVVTNASSAVTSSVQASKSLWASTNHIHPTPVAHNSVSSLPTTTQALLDVSIPDASLFTSPKTSFVPTTSHQTVFVPITQAPPQYSDDTVVKHRSVREVQSYSSSYEMSGSEENEVTDVYTGAIAFTNASEHGLVSLAVNISFIESGVVYRFNWFVMNNSAEFIQDGISLINSNSIAVPWNVILNISISLIAEKSSIPSVKGIHGDVQSNISFFAPFDANNTFMSSTTINSSSNGAFNFSFRFLEDEVAFLVMNFTSIKPMTMTPELIFAPAGQYKATEDRLLFVFGTNESLVQADWALFRTTGAAMLYRNTSKCEDTLCPNPNMNSSHANVTKTHDYCRNQDRYSCFLSMSYILQGGGEYRIEANLTNPVTRVPFQYNFSFTAETRISKLSISSCDYQANLDQRKKFHLIYEGDVLATAWDIDGETIANNVTSANYTATTLGNYTLTVRAWNHINSVTSFVNIAVLESGSIHGLKITSPLNASFHPTHKPIRFAVQLCEGTDPMLRWNFADNTSLVTNATNCSHIYNLPKTYFVNVKATNDKNKTELKSVIIHTQDEIKNFTVFVTKSIVEVNESFVFIANIDNGTDVAFNVSSARASVFRFTNTTAEGHRIPYAGNYTLKLTAFNRVSYEVIYLPVVVQERINLILERLVYKKSGTEELLSSIRKISGTHMYVKWDFGDGTETNWTFVDSHIPDVTHSYANEGGYSLTLFAKNHVTGIVNFTSLVFVERGLNDDINITLPTHVETNSSFTVNISIGITSIYGFNVSINGESSLMSSGDYQSEKRFASPGSRTLNFHIWNHVSSVSKVRKITVQDRIIGPIVVTPLFVAQSIESKLSATVEGTSPTFTWVFANHAITKTGSFINHVFQELGIVYFNVTASNKISSVTSLVHVYVEILISNFSLISNETFVAPEQPVRIKASLPLRNEHLYSWTVDGIGIDEHLDYIVVNFKTLGWHTVSITANNNISSKTVKVSVAVQDPIEGISVSLFNRIVSVIPFNESVTLRAQIAAGSNMTFIWCWNLNCVQSMNLHHNITVDNPDVFNVNVTFKALNDISQGEVTKQIPVMHRIRGVRLITQRSHILVNESAIFKVEYTAGSNVTTKWKINGADVISSGTVLNYTFREIMNYSVVVEISNPISSRQRQMIVYVLGSFDILDVFPRTVVTNQSVVFSVRPSIDVGVRLEWKVREIGAVLGSNGSITFTQAGIYQLSVNGTNPVCQVNRAFHIAVQDRIIGLAMLHDRIFYKNGTNANFSASISSGTNATFNWTIVPKLGATIQQGLNLFSTSFYLYNAGKYHVFVTAKNLVSSATASLEIYVQSVAKILSLYSHFGSIFPTNEQVAIIAAYSGTNVSVRFSWIGNVNSAVQMGTNLIVQMKQPGLFSVILALHNNVSSDERKFDFITQDRIENVSIRILKLTSPVPTGKNVSFQVITKRGSNLLYTWAINDTLLVNEASSVLTRSFNYAGIYEVKVNVSNGIMNGFQTSSVFIVVELPGCPPPVVAISGGSSRTLLKSQWLYFEASSTYNCQTSSVTSLWSLKIAKESTNCHFDRTLLQKYTFESNVILDGSLLAIQPGMLKEGLYCLYYQASYGDNGKFKIYDAARVKVRISS